MRAKRRFLALCCVVALSWTSPALLADDDPAPAEESSTWDLVLEYYEKAKEAGEQVPQDVYEWAKQDLSKIGAWEYRVEALNMSNPALLEKQLEPFGADRWECIWIEKVGDRTIFIFKRPVRSYLQNLSLSQLMKLVPRGDSGDSGD